MKFLKNLFFFFFTKAGNFQPQIFQAEETYSIIETNPLAEICQSKYEQDVL